MEVLLAERESSKLEWEVSFVFGNLELVSWPNIWEI